MESALVKDNPLLLPLNKEKTIYDGFITVKVTCVASLDETTFEQQENYIQKSVNLMITCYGQYYTHDRKKLETFR